MTVKFCCCAASSLLLGDNNFTSGSEVFIVTVK